MHFPVEYMASTLESFPMKEFDLFHCYLEWVKDEFQYEAIHHGRMSSWTCDPKKEAKDWHWWHRHQPHHLPLFHHHL